MQIDYSALITAPHILVAGSTGSGKSTLIHGIMGELLRHKCQIGLIDPKRVELSFYRGLNQVQFYTQDLTDIISWLDGTIDCLEDRYRYMSSKSLRECPYKHTYIIIDELADIMTQDKKGVSSRLQRIAQLGRAANIHLICATQAPDRTYTLPAPLKLNFTDKIALRCDTAIESKQVIGIKGAEELPIYGKALWRSPQYGLKLVDVPNYTDADIIRSLSQAAM